VVGVNLLLLNERVNVVAVETNQQAVPNAWNG